MSIVNDQASKSETEIALAELEKEGQFVEGKQPPETKEVEKPKEPSIEEKKEEISPVKTEEKKADRSPSMVEAWKLKVAEDQKEAALTAKKELEAKLEELSKQKGQITEDQASDISDEIKKLAGEKEVDVDFLTNFAQSILKKAGDKIKSVETLQKTVDELKKGEQLNKELIQYNEEFTKDILPLIKDFQLSDSTLLELKASLKDYAFSETYAKVPLKEIFLIKQSSLNIQAPKKSSEGKTIKGRANEVIDLENLSEEDFSKLPDSAIEALASKNKGSWNTRK